MRCHTCRLFVAALFSLIAAGIAVPAHAAGDSEPWTFTDDLGVTVTLDRRRIEIVEAEINLEALAAADPDLIVTNQYPVDRDGTIDESAPLYGFADTAQQAAVAEIAPIVTIAMRGSASDVIDRTTELAVALGASDDAGGVIATSHAEFEDASAALAVAGERGIEVVVLYAEPANVYVAKAPDDPSLRMYEELGVDFADPGGDDYYWS